MIRFLKIAVLAASLMLAGMASAGEEHKMKIQVVVDDADGGEAVHMSLDSDDLGFDLHDMQEGETRSVVDESGRSILVTREAKGFKFDIDGKTIEMPMMVEEHGAMWVGEEAGEDVQIHMMRDATFISEDDLNGVTILSGQPIDDITREGIKSLLTSSGHSGDVKFIDSSGTSDGPHEVRIIKKEVVSEN